MSDLDSINIWRKKLIDSLGNKDNEYLNLMKLWFKMKMTKEEFENETRKFLTPEQLYLHNQLLLHLLNKCVGLSTTPTTTENNGPRKKYTYFQPNFEPLDPTLYLLTERQEVKNETPQFIKYDRLLPDQSFTLARLMYGAWELGLEGSNNTTADLLVVATHQFLKNIITAIICRRKGYKHDLKFVHAVGEPMCNPWLRNVSQTDGSEFHSLKCNPTADGILVPSERPTIDQLEREAAHKLAASDSNDENLLPISLYDLVGTLKVYPSLVASNFIYTVNFERMLAKISHPSWDD